MGDIYSFHHVVKHTVRIVLLMAKNKTCNINDPIIKTGKRVSEQIVLREINSWQINTVVLREIQMKTAVKYYYSPIRKSKTKN